MNAWLDYAQLTIYILLGLGIIGTILFLWNALSSRNITIRQMQEDHEKLMRSFNELDEQAKLIVRTDLELNKAQEELDKRLNGINALQRASKDRGATPSSCVRYGNRSLIA